MNTWKKILDTFLLQAQTADLRTSEFPREYDDLRMRVSFGMGMPARVPWIAFTAPEMQVSKGFYPVYFYYKELNVLVLAYGISETYEFDKTWPDEIMNSSLTIKAFFDKDVPRYGDSLVFKAYNIIIKNDKVEYQYLSNVSKENQLVSEQDIETDLKNILNYYKKIVSIEIRKEDSVLNQGLFYMEKQLEDFIIHNWNITELGKRFDLIIEDGELVSQQFRTEIGPIDILAKDKNTGDYVVIELKKNQTSDDTVGQIARYMGWIKKNKNNPNVKGIIIAAEFDKKLEYALEVVQNVEVFLYQVDFKLKEFKGV
ncbi:MAG: PDDEXK nuclease domain-containing protein [Spirochaetes bacterium]|nr:PDDEXK nuclease domain-containing protein [Spirochaetota bacterium]